MTPMFPLESVLLPGEQLPLRIFEPRYSALVTDCMSALDQCFGVVLIEAGREVGGGEARSEVGALAHIDECHALGDGRFALRCGIGERIRVIEWLIDDPYPRATIEPWPDEPGREGTDAEIREIEERVVALYQRIAAARGGELRPEDVQLEPGASVSTEKRLYALASKIPMGQADRYSVLAAPTQAARLDALTEAVDTVIAMVDFQLSGGDQAGSSS